MSHKQLLMKQVSSFTLDGFAGGQIEGQTDRWIGSDDNAIWCPEMTS